MLQRRFFYLCLLLLSTRSAYSQVNLQTGSATFSLPIFNWQDDKSRLNSVVALSYNSGSGLKVSDLPSNVGQGWNLIAGGVIVRMQVGEPDDQWPREGTEWDSKKYPPGILYATVPTSQGCPTALAKYPIYGWKNQMYAQHNVIAEDKQLDYFSFQFNGKAGMFVVDPANIGNCKSIGDTKIKITFQQDASLINQGIRTRITSFTIQDVDGLKYKFTKHGLTKILKSEYCDANLTQYQQQPKFEGGKVYHQAGFDNGQIENPWVIGSWYLTEIEDPLTFRKILFNYTTRNINHDAGEQVIFNTTKNYPIIFHQRSITQTPSLTSVTFPDAHIVTINYGAARLDLTGDYALSSIDVSYYGRYLSRHELKTSYFILNRYGNPISDYQKKMSRLCLMSVRKIGNDLQEDTPPYQFDYYLGSAGPDDFVPPPFSYAKDIWGFFNGEKTRGFWYENIPLAGSLSNLTNSNHVKGLCYLRHDVPGIFLNPKTGYAKNGLLRQIVYPTGGTLTYEYEQNRGLLGGAEREVGGVHVSKTNSTDGEYSNGCNNPVVTEYNYVMNGPGSASSLWGLEPPVNSRTVQNHYQPEYRYYKWWECLPFGCCDWKFKYPGIETMQQFTDLAGLQKLMATLSPVLNIISLISTIKEVITVISGGNPVALIIDVILNIIQIAVSCIGNQERNREATQHYSFNLHDAAPLPTQFKRVEVTESPGGIGKTVQEFTSDTDYPIWEPTNLQFSSKQRFAPWAYGLPRKTIVYDIAGVKKKETENTFNFQTSYFTHCPPSHYTDRSLLLKKTLGIQSCKCVIKKSSSQRNTTWSYPNSGSYITSANDDLGVELYDVYTGRTELNKTLERTYKPNSSSEYIQTETEYVYNNENYEISLIKTRKSEDQYTFEYSQKNIYYTVDLIYIIGNCYTEYQPPVTTDPAIISMVQNNIINVPIETSEMISKFGSEEKYLGSKATLFTILSNGDIKPTKVLEGRLAEPAIKTPLYPHVYGNWGYYFPGPLCNPANPDYSFYKITQQFSYDGAGNLIGIKDEGNRQVVNLYGYIDKYVTASVINADAATDNPVHTSFEQYNDFGGWTKTGPGSDNTTTAITGAISYNFVTGDKPWLPATKLTNSLNTGKPYTISFWSTTSTITVTGGATLVKSAPTINGFTYYEYDIAQGTATVEVAGTGTVDELRCYPKASRMRTVTYDPIIGKTSECDENNRITYYEYDKMGRLRFIKDEKGNVVKMYEYNNVSPSKLNGCPGLYFNKAISETFTRNNCPPGYLGSEVSYLVPANLYVSLISQADADARAEAHLLANGQNHANTYGICRIIYYNTQQSQNFTTESCEPGYIGGTVTYTVPAGRYWSTISQAEANQIALDEIEANGPGYANMPPNAVCIPDNQPLWVWLEGADWYCANVGNEVHLFVLETDINPNSPSYLDLRWSDVGLSELCPAGLFYNTLQSANFTRNNCPPGHTGSTVTYTVPAGTYTSVVSVAAANQLALNDIALNGQNYANTYGTCTAGCVPNVCEVAPMYKCVSNVCETGVRVNTESYYAGNNMWVCIYHYEFSDGSWSINLVEYSTFIPNCPL